MSAEYIATQLGSIKKTSTGYLCKCPCHDDNTSSLSIKNSPDGIILNCFAGCDWKDIKEEIAKRGIAFTEKTKHAPPPKKRSNNYEGAIFYEYKDLNGSTLARKVKLPNKAQWFERKQGNSYVKGLDGQQLPLYNIGGVVKNQTIYLCEGEKDAETLIKAGLTATTNHSGALGWAPHMTEQLKGKTVIIIPDNDDAGKKRVQKLTPLLSSAVNELRQFMPGNVPEKGDITDWVEAGNDPKTILEKSHPIKKAKPRKKATRDEYFQLFEQVLENPRRCIFNEKLMHYDERTKLWNPCVNALDIIKSEALVANETREAKFSVNSIAPHFFAFEAHHELEFLVNIPDWDGHDRISDMASLITLNPTAEISQDSFTELLKEWCSRVFLRLHDPMIQNRILVLQGGQGIGKDTWTSMLVDGLGQFCIPLSVVKEDKDTYLNLHRGLIMKISEFDKTAKTEVSTLKDIITAPSTNLRAPYDKDSKVRMSRCSFISSANAENLLRDSTGNRRFLIFEVEHIQFAYEGWSVKKTKEWQMQCLAQMVTLSQNNYTASDKAWVEMNNYIERCTPRDPGEEMLEQFYLKLRSDRLFISENTEILPTHEKVVKIIHELSRETGLKPRGIKTLLQNKIGVFKRRGNKRYWALRLPALKVFDEIEQLHRQKEDDTEIDLSSVEAVYQEMF